MTHILKRLAARKEASYMKADARSLKKDKQHLYFDGIAEGLTIAIEMVRDDLKRETCPKINMKYDPDRAYDIIMLIKKELAHRTNLYIRAHSEDAGTRAAYDRWETEFKKSDNLGPDFGFGRNPHSITRTSEQLAIAMQAKEQWQAIFDYAIETFIRDPRKGA